MKKWRELVKVGGLPTMITAYPHNKWAADLLDNLEELIPLPPTNPLSPYSRTKLRMWVQEARWAGIITYDEYNKINVMLSL